MCPTSHACLDAVTRSPCILTVWCSELTTEFRSHVPNCCKTNSFAFFAEIEEESTIAETASAVRKAAGSMPIVACIVGGESGVTLADGLSCELKVVSNGVFSGGDRRNKSVQQKAIKAAGLRAVREACGKTYSEVSAFVENESLPIVVKPVESCGSEGVKICRTKNEVQDHFTLLMEGQRKVGAQGAAVLCQEFLTGTEYVVDHVSCDGVHKTMMVWVYDKRPTNGGDFVYYGMVPVDSQSKEAQILIKYTRAVLDALKLHNGPSHGEVMMGPDNVPCLVEMNCRSHGWDGAWVPLAKKLTGGYSQPDVALDSHVDAVAFDRIPDITPSPFKASGQAVMLVSFHSGTIARMPGYEKIRDMSSFLSLQTGYTVGSKVDLTIDLFTAVGVVMFANEDSTQLAADLDSVRKMEKGGLFEFEEEA